MVGRVTLPAGPYEHPRYRGVKWLESRQPRPFSAVAVTGRMAVDEARIDGAQLLPSHAQAFHRTEPHVVVNDVGFSHQLMDELAALLAFEIDRDTLFAALNTQKNAQLWPAHRIAPVFLNLDDAGSEVREQPIGEGTRHVSAEIEHQHAIERPYSLACVGQAFQPVIRKQGDFSLVPLLDCAVIAAGAVR